MPKQGYFAIIRMHEMFIASNYDSNMTACVNGLMLHMTKKTNYFNDVENIKGVPRPIDIGKELYQSDFIEQGYRHFYQKVIEIGNGHIYIYKYEHGSLQKYNTKPKVNNKPFFKQYN